MKTHLSLSFLLLLSLFISCENNNEKNPIAFDSAKTHSDSIHTDSVVLTNADTISDSATAKSNSESLMNQANLKTADFIKQYPGSQKTELRNLIEYLRTEWENVPNPFTATYEGNELGDYHHILFKDKSGKVYDFGQANNDFGAYKLFEQTGQYEDNPAYLHKEFNVYWDWKLSDFLCCDGEYGNAKAYLPAVTKLELIKK